MRPGDVPEEARPTVARAAGAGIVIDMGVLSSVSNWFVLTGPPRRSAWTSELSSLETPRERHLAGVGTCGVLPWLPRRRRAYPSTGRDERSHGIGGARSSPPVNSVNPRDS